ncbi:MAG: shikimate dehydrogenase [Leptolyngbyaceae bacterium]|nr:shikimate dehydrogenase [Leptolyngbyaceae bacterium]
MEREFNIKGTTRLLGVIGDPVKHSFSPAMHNAAIAHLGVDYVYLPLPVAAHRLKDALLGFDAIDVQGFNITIPHKQAIIPLLDAVSDTAQAIGAVNTVWKTEAGWNGTNTDMDGFLAPLQAMGRSWAQVTAVVLGNGGAARAVVAGCHALGCSSIHVVGRNAEKLTQFQHSWHGSPIENHLVTHLWEQLPDLISTAGLIVNTTPVGMAPHVTASPLDSASIAHIQPGAIAYDLIYTPSPTLFLQQAAEKGAIALDGLEMLVQQGATALEIWLQHPAPIEVMRTALLHQLQHRKNQ